MTPMRSGFPPTGLEELPPAPKPRLGIAAKAVNAINEVRRVRAMWVSYVLR
jgi:hypothetical protein